ncbi:MAG TPA: MerR family transcriptional regulator [Candidatus Accumulibacter sp.]|nr:MerR family transcriptional regulator [Accumulibacter sp.]HRF10767.1 MerR family DNA-binding protein [Candidatus Accumulibacter phosphatis]
MKVSELASLTGASPDTVRYYVQIGLLRPAKDPANGYRRFNGVDTRRLRFISRAKRLGFQLDEIAQILGMSDRGDTPCPVVREIVQRRIVETRERLAEIQALQARLEQALELWAEMPDGEPDGHAACALIDATSDERNNPQA